MTIEMRRYSKSLNIFIVVLLLLIMIIRHFHSIFTCPIRLYLVDIFMSLTGTLLQYYESVLIGLQLVRSCIVSDLELQIPDVGVKRSV